MLAHDFGNGVVLVWLLRLLCMTMLGLLLWLENCEIFRKKLQIFYSSYPKSAVWVGCFSTFRCTMSL